MLFLKNVKLLFNVFFRLNELSNLIISLFKFFLENIDGLIFYLDIA